MSERVIGPYRVYEELGAGGMGTVYRAEVVGRVAGLAQGTIVALKVVHPHLLRSSGFFKRFLREGEIGKRIRHENVVATLDLDGIRVGAETVLYLAMEYVEGVNLWNLMEEVRIAAEDLCRHVAGEVLKGLAAIHALGVVHRDIKPENILVTRDHRIKLMDLGVARLMEESVRLSSTGMFVGSPLYAAPEQFGESASDLDHRVDLHALGLILYEMATGEHPYAAESPTEIVRRLKEETPRRISESNPHMSPFFAEFVHTLLAKDREQRFASAVDAGLVLLEGESAAWWKERAKAIRVRPDRPLRRPQVARETAMIGRDLEVAMLRGVFERVKAGEGRVVLIEGETGIGKTRLVEEFVADLARHGEDATFLVGAYPSAGHANAWSPLVAAFREHFGDTDLEGTARRHLDDTPLLVDAFVALLRGSPAPSRAEPLTPESLQTVFVGAAGSLATSRPVILLMEDLQFAPEQGLALFAALALGITRRRILLIGSARPGLSDAWLASIGSLSNATRIVLSRLSLKDIARLVVAAVGSERLADEIGFQVVEKSDGNPFFLLEILRSLRDQGLVARDEHGQWQVKQTLREIPIPSSVQGIVRARIASLSDDERDLLEVAACCGFEFDPSTVCEAMHQPPVAVLKRLAKIERDHRLVHALGDRYVFDHREIHDAIRAGISDALRREYHAAIAEVLETRTKARGRPSGRGHGSIELELTEHFLAAGLGDRARPYVTLALNHLDDTHAGDVAADLALRALAAPDAVLAADRPEILLRQADRLQMIGRYAEGIAVLKEAQVIADAEDDADLRTRTRVAMARCYRELAMYDPARSLAEEALSLATSAGNKRIEAQAHDILGDLHRELARYDEARAQYARALTLWEEAGDHEGEAIAVGKLGTVDYLVGRFEEAYANFLRNLTLTRTTRSSLGKAQVKHQVGSVLFALGRYEDARAHFARCLSICRLLGFRRGEAVALIELGEVSLMLGDSDSASRHLLAARRLCVETGARFVHARALHALGEVSAAAGDSQRAIGRTKRAVRLRRALGDRAGLVTSLLQLGRLRKTVGTLEAARGAFEEAERIAQELDVPAERVLASAHLAALPRGDARAALETISIHERRLKLSDRMEARTLLWEATGEPSHLAEAKRLLEHVLENAPQEHRSAIVASVPLHRTVAGAASASGVGKSPQDGDGY